MDLKKLISIILKSHMKKYVTSSPTINYTNQFDIFTHTMLRASKSNKIDDEIISVLIDTIREDKEV